jgi:hypothetical protein
VNLKLYEWAGFCIDKRRTYIQDMKENEIPITDVEDIDPK